MQAATEMKMERRVSFSPQAGTKHKAAAGNKDRVFFKIWTFEGSRFSVGSFFKNLGEKVAKALPRRCSRKVSSSASLARSRSYAETLDSHRAEAIEDCIEFLNSSSSSSSSLKRSNSVSSSN